MRKAIDLTGQVFGRLTAIRPTEQRIGGSVGWLCRCSCEAQTEVVVSSTYLRSGHTRSCGCLRAEAGKRRVIDLTGQVFGRLTAIRPTEQKIASSVGWLCRCSCEAHTEVVVSASYLRTGGTQSCGCLQKEARKEMIADLTGQVFGRLTAIRPTEQRIAGSVGWLCRCSCEAHTEIVASAKNLHAGLNRSCGCLAKERKGKKNPWIDLTGRQFNNLLVLHDSGKRSDDKQILWTCKCTICGATTLVTTNYLKSGRAKSCGCIKKLDLRGQKFGRLKAIKPSLMKKSGRILWYCECDCGNKNVLVNGSDLLNGVIRSCGCLLKEARKRRASDLTGQVFGRLTAIRPTEQRNSNGSVMWLCQCSCEEQTEVVVSAGNLRSGGTRSCGCLKRERRKTNPEGDAINEKSN